MTYNLEMKGLRDEGMSAYAVLEVEFIYNEKGLGRVFKKEKGHPAARCSPMP